ncbi:MAG TPA: HAD-IA family hydrolase [Thermoanaerobaculia bacterium]|jgi:2-haloalkanoic acid dehalogenase type II
MQRLYDVVTFDCYGTLIDWESGISSAFLEEARRDGTTLDRAAVLGVYAKVEPVVESERYQTYRDVLTETAVRVAQRFDWSIDRERAAFLANSLPSWTPFADTNPALRHLKAAGYRLGILSNTDDDLIAATQHHFSVEFDFVITAQQVRAYKPAHAHFLAARDRIGSARWLHAAESNFHDVVPTNALRIPNAWVNRGRRDALPGGAPTHHVSTLAELADLVVR